MEHLERSHSGLVRTLGKRVYRKVSRVQIPPSPPLLAEASYGGQGPQVDCEGEFGLTMEYNFCPKCGSKSERKLTNLLVCPNCGYNFYINPSPTNGLIIENSKGEILLVKRKLEPKKGYLDVAGGFVEPGESLEESCVREAKEELGVDISEIRYFKSYPDQYLYLGVNIKTIGFVLTAKIEDGADIRPADDVEEADFYPKDKIPFEKIAFDSIRRGLIDYLKEKS